MGRTLISAMLLISMALVFYSSTLWAVQVDDNTMLVTLDVCSDDMNAGTMAFPTVPAPLFSFTLNRAFENISCKECLLFSLQYPAVPDRPPAA